MTSGWRRILGSPFTWCAAGLVVAELSMGLVLPYDGRPRAHEALRQPDRWRGWPEYVEGDGVEGDGIAPGSPLVVVVSNSQAHGPGIDDPEDIWFATLRRGLAERGLSRRVENWSGPGLRTAHLELLSLQAVQRQADFVLIVAGVRNIDRPGDLSLDRGQADVHLLAGRPASWPELPRTAFGREARLDDLLGRTLRSHSSLVRSREWAFDETARRVDLSRHRYVHGRPWVNSLGEKLKEHRLRTLLGLPSVAPPQDFFDADAVDVADSLATFRRAYAGLHERFERAGVEYRWVWMPLPARLGPDRLAIVRSFNRQASAIAEEVGRPTVDWTETLADELFLDGVHLNEVGHAALGPRLLELVTRELR